MQKIVPAILVAISLLTSCWFASDATWDLFPRDHVGYYENHGQRLLEGRLDVDYHAIRGEALVKDGRFYGYFGPVPALSRVVLSAIYPSHAYHWSAFSVLCGILVTLLLVWSLISNTLADITAISPKEKLFVKYLLLANIGLGSSLITLSSPAFIYHEAIVWGSAFVLAASLALLRYMEDLKLSHALFAAGMSFLAINTRASAGFGAIVMLFCVFGAAILFSREGSNRWSQKMAVYFGVSPLFRDNRRHLYLMVLVLTVATTPYALSYAKYGEFSLFPLRYHSGLTPERAARINNSFVHIGNIPFNLSHYFNPLGVSGSSVFPYFKPAPRDWGWRRSADVHFDRGEPFLPLTVSMPVWVLLMFAGLYYMALGHPKLCRRTGIVIGTLMGGGTIMVVAGITPRYLHDLFPFLVITGTAGLVWLAELSIRKRIIIYVMIAFLTLISIYVNCSLCLLNIFSGNGLRNELLQLRDKLDGKDVKIGVVNYNSAGIENGIVFDSNIKRWGVVLPKQITPAGKSIEFASSGVRNVKGYNNLDVNSIVWVDGPLEPLKDGAPAIVVFRTDPCINNIDCIHAVADQ